MIHLIQTQHKYTLHDSAEQFLARYNRRTATYSRPALLQAHAASIAVISNHPVCLPLTDIRCCSSNVIFAVKDNNSGHLSMLRKGRFDQHIGHQAGVGQLFPGDRREGAALQPVLDGSALISVPISRDHWIHHHHL